MVVNERLMRGSWERSEARATKTPEQSTAAIPPSVFLGIAAGAMALSLGLHVAGRGKWGNFIAQWAPAWLMIGVYSQLVKLEGQDYPARSRWGGADNDPTAKDYSGPKRETSYSPGPDSCDTPG